ncbi:MAG: HNH endonuclease [Actinobacteria bacterium]|nr:HNH endonuclease [Actinomycetota bacterium]
MTCSEPGCDRPSQVRGLCRTCYARLRKRGTLPPKTRQSTDRTCAAPDCDRAVGLAGARGLCGKHYQRLTKSNWGLEQPIRTASLKERFYAKVSKEPCSCGAGCLLWTGGISPTTGYGHFSIKNKSYVAHRIAYEFAFGPIPDGLVIDHVYERGCRHRACVNPAHLEAVTATVNNQRTYISPVVSARRAAAGRKGAAARWGTKPPAA